MNAVFAALICLSGALVCSVLKPQRPELSFAVALGAGVAALAVCLPDMTAALSAVRQLMDGAGVEGDYARVMLRACGVSMIAEFAAQACTDAGEKALSGRVRLAARLALLAMAVPLVTSILSRISALLGL